MKRHLQNNWKKLQEEEEQGESKYLPLLFHLIEQNKKVLHTFRVLTNKNSNSFAGEKQQKKRKPRERERGKAKL